MFHAAVGCVELGRKMFHCAAWCVVLGRRFYQARDGAGAGAGESSPLLGLLLVTAV